MRRKLCFFLCAGSLSLSWQAYAATCSCTAPDRSCSASITCSGACSAVCSNNGDCSAKCSGGSGTEPFTPFLTELPGPGEGDSGAVALQDKRNNLVSLNLESASSREVSAALTELAGVPVVWMPKRSGFTISMQVQDYPMDLLLASLAKRGAVAVMGRAPETRATPRNTSLSRSVTVQAMDADVTTLSSLLGELLQGTVELKAKDPKLIVNLDMKEMPVREVVRQLAKFGELTLDGEPLNK